MKLLSNIKKGAIGEKFTCKYLRKNGFRIIGKNVRNKFSELAIIAENKEYIVFVEVKTRTHNDAFNPADAVNSNKQQKILKAAKYYLSYTYETDKQPRFDIAEVTINEKGKCTYINYIENAFSQGGNYAVF